MTGPKPEAETASGTESSAAAETASSAAAETASSAAAGIIRVAAALITDDTGRLLLVRKAGTTVFMQPGGKYEPGESGAQTLVRELHEELGLELSTAALEPLGTFIAPAANEAGMLVEAEVFRVTLPQHEPPSDHGEARSMADVHGHSVPQPGAEIAELRWVHPDDFGALAVAPLITERMLDLLRPQ